MDALIGSLASGTTVLAAMITPAVLISACGTLVLSTSNRLARTVERARHLADALDTHTEASSPARLSPERRGLLTDQLRRAARRSALLQRALARFYVAIAFFVATSLASGTLAAARQNVTWLPIVLGIVGALLLLQASGLLIIESRIAISAIHDEMAFVLRRDTREPQTPGGVA